MVFADAPYVLRLQPVIILKVLMVISKRDDAHGGTSEDEMKIFWR